MRKRRSRLLRALHRYHEVGGMELGEAAQASVCRGTHPVHEPTLNLLLYMQASLPPKNRYIYR